MDDKEKLFYRILNFVLGIILIAWAIVFFVNRKFFSLDLTTSHKILFYGGLILIPILVLVLYLKRKYVYNKRKQLLLSLITFIILLFVLEGFLRIIYHEEPRFTKHHYLNYINTPNYESRDGLNIHNSLGYRGPEIDLTKSDDRYRIIIMGGSSTYTTGVSDWKKDWARTLERHLRDLYQNENIEVINAGTGGWNSWETLISFQTRVLDLDPDLVIFYHGTNDVHTRMVNPEFYRGDNSGRRIQWETPNCRWFLCSVTISKLAGLENNVMNVDAETFGPTSDSEYSKILGMTPFEALQLNQPVYFKRNIENIIAIADRNNIDVLLSTWAHTDQFGDYAATEHYEIGFVENNQVVKDVGLAENVPVYDFVSEMPKDKEFWVDGRHVNEKGSDLKGKLFADFIFENNLINE